MAADDLNDILAQLRMLRSDLATDKTARTDSDRDLGAIIDRLSEMRESMEKCRRQTEE
jgi:hypothetical protein